MKLMKFTTFCLLEDRVDYVKKINPEIDSSHDVYATHRDPGDIVNHFATHADPTAKKTHTQWIVNQYKKGNFRQEDHPRIKTALEGFEKFKGKLDKKDINQYKSLSDVESAVEPHMGSAASHKEEKRQAKIEGAELVHSENGLTVHRIDTHGAAKLYGKGTKWCTNSDDPAAYNEYAKDGPLYVVHTPDNQKYQFHLPSNQFKDAGDNEIKLGPMVNKHPELKNVSDFSNTDHRKKLYFTPESSGKSATLDRLQQSNNPSDRKVAADISSEHAGRLIGDMDSGVRETVASHPEHAGKLVSDPYESVRRVVAQHPEHAGKLVNDQDASVRMAVAEHPAHAGKLVNDPHYFVREEVAKHPEHAGKLINDPAESVRSIVAKHPEHAGKLINDPNQFVREGVAQHPEHAGKLVNDRDPMVRAFVAKHPEHAGKLVNDPNDLVRQMVSKHPEHAGKLVNDRDPMVRAGVAQHPEHAGKLVNDRDAMVRQEVAHHPEHAGKLINDSDRYVRMDAKRTLGLDQ